MKAKEEILTVFTETFVGSFVAYGSTTIAGQDAYDYVKELYGERVAVVAKRAIDPRKLMDLTKKVLVMVNGQIDEFVSTIK